MHVLWWQDDCSRVYVPNTDCLSTLSQLFCICSSSLGWRITTRRTCKNQPLWLQITTMPFINSCIHRYACVWFCACVCTSVYCSLYYTQMIKQFFVSHTIHINIRLEDRLMWTLDIWTMKANGVMLKINLNAGHNIRADCVASCRVMLRA